MKVIDSVFAFILRNISRVLKPVLLYHDFFHHRVFGPADRVRIAKTAVVNNALFNTNSGTVTVEDYAFFGHGVSLVTGTHEYKVFDQERISTTPKTGRDIVIGRGAFIGINSTILGPCVIGEHAVVAAGSLVNKNVEPYTIVGGVPAKFIKRIEHDDK